MTIYVDMDGVIADFFTELANYAETKHWKEIPDKEATIDELRGTDFFARLPKFKTSDDLIAFVDKETNGKWCILSAPLRNDYDNCTFWKRQWLEKNGYNPKEAIFTKLKEKFALDSKGRPNILIDDRPENIDRWIEAGGIGIRYQADEDSLEDLIMKVKGAINE